jgi:hypothetical protein
MKLIPKLVRFDGQLGKIMVSSSTSTSSAASDCLTAFCLPSRGKPNPKQPRPPLSEPDTRERVVQAAQKGMSCSEYAYNLIRPRIKAPNTDGLYERHVERAASLKRRKQREIDKEYLFIACLDRDLIAKMRGMDKKHFTKRDPRDPLVLCNSGKELDLTPDIPKFLAQREIDNFYDFLIEKYLVQKIKVNQDFLKEIGVDLDQSFWELFKPKLPLHYGFEIDFENNTALDQWAISDGIAHLEYAKRMHLKISDWTPDKSVEDLVKQLNQYGPIVVAGLYGKHYYSGKPGVIDDIVGHRANGWRADQRLGEDTAIMSHCIAVVGADSAKRRVYFIDPADRSDPRDPTPTKIYVMSYDRFKDLNTMHTHFGVCLSEVQSKFVYALRGPTLDELRRVSVEPVEKKT